MSPFKKKFRIFHFAITDIIILVIYKQLSVTHSHSGNPFSMKNYFFINGSNLQKQLFRSVKSYEKGHRSLAKETVRSVSSTGSTVFGNCCYKQMYSIVIFSYLLIELHYSGLPWLRHSHPAPNI